MRILHQEPEDFVFGLGEVDFLAVHPDPVAVQLQFHPVGGNPLDLRNGPRTGFALVDAVPAQQGLDPGTQLGKGKGFGQIVIPARRQSQQFVRLLGLGGQKQDGHRGNFPQFLADPQARHPRHHHIQNHQVHLGRKPLESLGAVFGFQDAVPLAGQQNPNAVPDLGVVLCNQNRLFCHLLASSLGNPEFKYSGEIL